MKTQLRIANWNVMRATPNTSRFGAVEGYCHAQDVDIWFLTETHQDLSPHQGYFGIHSGTPDRLFKPGEKWSSIWSKWPIESMSGFVTDGSRCVAGRIEHNVLGEIILYGTVLPWNNDLRVKESSSFQAYQEALEVQKSDWLRIQRDFPQATLIIAGDFNQGLVDKHFYGSRKKQNLLESAIKECQISPLTAGANDPIARDSHPRANIDHIFVASSFVWNLEKSNRWPDTQVPVKNLSDHFGVSLEVSLNSDKRSVPIFN